MTMTREQKRGLKAFDHAREIENWDKTDRDDYGRYAHKLPVLIRTAGLAQAIAYTEAKCAQRAGVLELLDNLAEQANDNGMLEEGNGRQALSAASKSVNLSAYRMLTQEIQACLVWYKRFAVSVLKVEPENGRES